MLLAGADRGKDQSYFLSGVRAEAFREVVFLLGHLARSAGQKGEGAGGSTRDGRRP